jgi:hypothetical protein
MSQWLTVYRDNFDFLPYSSVIYGTPIAALTTSVQVLVTTYTYCHVHLQGWLLLFLCKQCTFCCNITGRVGVGRGALAAIVAVKNSTVLRHKWLTLPQFQLIPNTLHTSFTGMMHGQKNKITHKRSRSQTCGYIFWPLTALTNWS